jgi:hypothetical protein
VTTRKAELWTCYDDAEELDHRDLGDAIGERLNCDCGEWPDTITAYGFAPLVISDKSRNALAVQMAERVVDTLDDEFGGGENGPGAETDDVLGFAQVFVRCVLSKYSVWRCEKVCEETINVADWVKENMPEYEFEEAVTEWVDRRLVSPNGQV